MKDKINLAKKIKALADRGIGGEQENARRMLEKFMKENGITDADLESSIEKHFRFKLPGHSDNARKLFYQIVHALVGIEKLYEKRGERSTKYVLCTSDHAVEIEAQFGFYSRLLKKELDLFYTAFLCKHGIFGKEKVNNGKPDLSNEEIKRLKVLAAGLSDQSYHKQLGEGGQSV